MYRVNTQKLTSNESKNDKYIEEIDSGVTDFSVLGSDRILYYRDSNSGRELNFYDGKDTKEIDSKVKAQCHSGNVVYYLRDEGDDYNYELYYYNLKTGKHGDIDECIEVADYNENEILYSVSDGDTCDIYKAKPGSEGTKIVSDVASDWTGNLDAGVISYKREIKESKSYYDFVNDPYAAWDATPLMRTDSLDLCSSPTGRKLVRIPYDDAAGDVLIQSSVIPSESDHIDQALEVLNQVDTAKEMSELLLYGIKDTDYTSDGNTYQTDKKWSELDLYRIPLGNLSVCMIMEPYVDTEIKTTRSDIDKLHEAGIDAVVDEMNQQIN